MKNLILVFVAFVITTGVYAQGDSTKRNMSPQDMNNNQNQNVQNHRAGKSHPDGVMLQNGKMMMVKNGQTTILDHDMNMSNGTKIMSNGTCIKKDGTKIMLKEGQHIDMFGNMISMKTNKKKNMYLVPDSNRKKDNK